MEIDVAIKFFGAMFAIMNPATILPIFLGITEGAPKAERRQIALKTTFYALIMGLVIALTGNRVLDLFDISINDFRVAGGLVVLFIGLNMLNGNDSKSHQGTDEEHDSYPDATQVAFYPMAFPMIIGPGTITTLILFSGEASSVTERFIIGGIFIGVLLIVGIVIYFAGDLAKYLSETARVIMGRLMGMILAAIAIDMIADGLKELLPGLA